eukprot:3940348-Pyramimonas_sp.AAC.2
MVWPNRARGEKILYRYRRSGLRSRGDIQPAHAHTHNIVTKVSLTLVAKGLADVGICSLLLRDWLAPRAYAPSSHTIGSCRGHMLPPLA